ncbi:MAG: AraC family transcriptional regulator ligand-binding domain-containing protein [Burkholderiales bacterium]|nr:AraC family transcriptional regulator ligand-binding domain-containing protein [Burkholderiales bacterium]
MPNKRWIGPREAYIRADCLFGFENLIRSFGGNPFDLAGQAVLPRQAFTNSDMLISWPRQGLFCELAARALNRPNFGLEHALSLPDTYPNAGAAIFLSQITKTFEEWLGACERYARYHTNAWTPLLIKDDSPFVRLRFLEYPLARSLRHQAEGLSASLYLMARTVMNATTERPQLVRFRHARPADTRLHEEVFGCPIEFGAPCTEMLFLREYLERPTNGRLVKLRPLLDTYLRFRIARMPLYDQSVAATVAAGIPAVLGTSLCSVENFATSMGLSSKKMQRLLRDEGTSFSAILEEVRESLAREMLETTEVPVGNICGFLGYAGLPSFNLAFKRWTDMSPTAYRELNRKKSVGSGPARLHIWGHK